MAGESCKLEGSLVTEGDKHILLLLGESSSTHLVSSSGASTQSTFLMRSGD